jgi:hypothetical protein
MNRGRIASILMPAMHHVCGDARESYTARPHKFPLPVRCDPSAVIPTSRGEFLTTCYDSGSIGSISSDGKDLPAYTHDKDGNAFVGPNDFAPDRHGGGQRNRLGFARIEHRLELYDQGTIGRRAHLPTTRISMAQWLAPRRHTQLNQ